MLPLLLTAALIAAEPAPEPALGPSPAAALVRFDFETGDLQGWRVVEGKFDALVSARETYHNFPAVKYNKQGRYYLSTVEQSGGLPSNDGMTGTVESPVFVLDGPDLDFLAGGGRHESAYIALCTLDGSEALKARGEEIEEMKRIRWSVPHLAGKPVFLRIVDHETRGWGHVTFDDFTARGRIDPDATRENFAAALRRGALRELRARLAALDLPALRRAIEDMTVSFDGYRAEGEGRLERLAALEGRIAAIEGAIEAGKPSFDPAAAGNPDALTGEIETFRRESLLSNPLLRAHPILFVVRPPYRSSYHAIDTLFHTGEANTGLFGGPGALKVLDLGRGGRVSTILELPRGIARDPEVSFDGSRIVFALRRELGEDYHIFEIGAGGSGLRQITTAIGSSDFDPLYLPDGDIAFSSTRDPKYNMCSQDIAANLFRMGPDGSNIHQIDRNNLFDNQASLLPDGRLLYARWEYVDRNFGDAHGLWTANPDGTDHRIFWGNNTASPGAAYTPRPIPGTHRAVCIFGPHHARLEGAMAVVDPALGLDGRPGVVRIWPPSSMALVRHGGPFDCDAFHSVSPKYADPYPLSERYFLCSRGTGRGEEMGIYLVDVFGNETLVHSEPPGCYDPMPLGPRPRPRIIPARRDLESASGAFYVLDVYRSTHMKGIPRGTVKRIRVVESPPKRAWSDGRWFGQGYTAPGMNWHSLENKRILGSAPVEEDGSAYLEVPADRFVFFQLLDGDGMMVQSMRSGAFLMSGERTGCAGCHEDRLSAPPAALSRPPLALRRPPSRLEPWRGEPRLFGFAAEVQPVLDRHCVRCHDRGKPAGEKLVLAGDRDMTFSWSYMELWRKGYVTCAGAGPAEILEAGSWGARASRVFQVIRKGHGDVRLSEEEMDRIAVWLDLNGVYYPDYACAYPEHLTGRCPLDPGQVARLTALSGVPFADLVSFSSSRGPQVSFDRPELSPCLAAFPDPADPRRAEALGIIRSGAEMLARKPECDRPGFVPCDADRRRLAHAEKRERIEAANRAAARSGERRLDGGPEAAGN